MNNREWQKDLEDVLNEYVASNSAPNKETLSEWIRRYPEYKQELIDFTASWSLMNHLPPSPKAEKVDEDTLVLRGMSVVQRIMYQKGEQQSAGNETPLSGLLNEGKKQGLSINDLAERSNLSLSLVRKLDRRLIRVSSIPTKAIDGIARAITCVASVVSQYLQADPKPMKRARYRADERISSTSEKEDFFDAVRNDPNIEEERRRYWLALEPHNKPE